MSFVSATYKNFPLYINRIIWDCIILNTKINAKLTLSSRCNLTSGYINMCRILPSINSSSLFRSTKLCPQMKQAYFKGISYRILLYKGRLSTSQVDLRINTPGRNLNQKKNDEKLHQLNILIYYINAKCYISSHSSDQS